MKEYIKPEIIENDCVMEGVYAIEGSGNHASDSVGSGSDKDNTKCRFGRKFANPHADVCQSCSISGGNLKKVHGAHYGDFTVCVENKTVKEFKH